MKPTVTIESLGCQYILEDEKYQYIVDNLGKPLPLANIWWDEGNVTHFSIRCGDGIITIFDTNKPKGEFWNGIKLQLG